MESYSDLALVRTNLPAYSEVIRALAQLCREMAMEPLSVSGLVYYELLRLGATGTRNDVREVLDTMLVYLHYGYSSPSPLVGPTVRAVLKLVALRECGKAHEHPVESDSAYACGRPPIYRTLVSVCQANGRTVMSYVTRAEAAEFVARRRLGTYRVRQHYNGRESDDDVTLNESLRVVVEQGRYLQKALKAVPHYRRNFQSAQAFLIQAARCAWRHALVVLEDDFLAYEAEQRQVSAILTAMDAYQMRMPSQAVTTGVRHISLEA